VPFSLSPCARTQVFLCCMHRCCRLRPLHGHRGRGVEKLPVKLTFETMAVIGSLPSGSTRRIHRISSVGRVTRRSGCGMLTVARSSRSSRATGNRILRKVAIFPHTSESDEQVIIPLSSYIDSLVSLIETFPSTRTCRRTCAARFGWSLPADMSQPYNEYKEIN